MATGSTAKTKKSDPIGSRASATKRICAACPGGRLRDARARTGALPVRPGIAAVPPATAIRLRADRLIDHGVDVLLARREGGVRVLLAEGDAGKCVVVELEKRVAVAHRANPFAVGKGGEACCQLRSRFQDLRVVDQIGARREGEGGYVPIADVVRLVHESDETPGSLLDLGRRAGIDDLAPTRFGGELRLRAGIRRDPRVLECKIRKSGRLGDYPRAAHRHPGLALEEELVRLPSVGIDAVNLVGR